MAEYLNGRIQSAPEQKPGREPDMSAAAADAMKAVLNELGGLGGVKAGGAAAQHGQSARLEAARKLLANFDAVLKD
eukprot:3189690-Prymnesium_polylepis.1